MCISKQKSHALDVHILYLAINNIKIVGSREMKLAYNPDFYVRKDKQCCHKEMMCIVNIALLLSENVINSSH